MTVVGSISPRATASRELTLSSHRGYRISTVHIDTTAACVSRYPDVADVVNVVNVVSVVNAVSAAKDTRLRVQGRFCECGEPHSVYGSLCMLTNEVASFCSLCISSSVAAAVLGGSSRTSTGGKLAQNSTALCRPENIAVVDASAK